MVIQDKKIKVMKTTRNMKKKSEQYFTQLTLKISSLAMFQFI